MFNLQQCCAVQIKAFTMEISSELNHTFYWSTTTVIFQLFSEKLYWKLYSIHYFNAPQSNKYFNACHWCWGWNKCIMKSVHSTFHNYETDEILWHCHSWFNYQFYMHDVNVIEKCEPFRSFHKIYWMLREY